MDIVKFPKSSPPAITLLTIEEKVDYLASNVLPDLPNAGKLFYPDDAFYAPLTSDKDLHRMADTLLSWLGIKHRSLEVLFSDMHNDTAEYVDDPSGRKIIVHTSRQSNPYDCAAILAHCIAHFVLIGRYKIALNGTGENEVLTDLATIHFGFGIIMLNSTKAKKRYADRFKVTKPLTIGSLQAASYADAFLSWTHSHDISENQFYPYILPWARPLLPKSNKAYRLSRAVRTADRQHAMLVRYRMLGVVLIIGIIGAAVYVSTANETVSSDIITQKEKVDILRTQLDTCAREIDTKAAQLGESADIFTERALDAEQSSCKSIENRYRSELEAYARRLQSAD